MLLIGHDEGGRGEKERDEDRERAGWRAPTRMSLV